jgi:hypothetical protein
MFALRDFGAGSKEAVLALADGFNDDSTLFRYVSNFRVHPKLLPNPNHPIRHDSYQSLLVGHLASVVTDQTVTR